MKSIVHVHVPKTGGTWVEQILDKYAGDYLIYSGHGSVDYNVHFDWQKPISSIVDGRDSQLKVGFPKKSGVNFSYTSPERYKHSVKIAAVRNPFEMLASMYFHADGGIRYKCKQRQQRSGLPDGWDLINVIHGLRSFEEFILTFCDPDFPFYHKRYQQNLFYQLFTGSGLCGVDLIMRTEYQSRGLATWLLAEGYVTPSGFEEICQVPKANARREKSSYRNLYTDDMREMVEKHCALELELFGYDFDGPKDNDCFLDTSLIKLSN